MVLMHAVSLRVMIQRDALRRTFFGSAKASSEDQCRKGFLLYWKAGSRHYLGECCKFHRTSQRSICYGERVVYLGRHLGSWCWRCHNLHVCRSRLQFLSLNTHVCHRDIFRSVPKPLLRAENVTSQASAAFLFSLRQILPEPLLFEKNFGSGVHSRWYYVSRSSSHRASWRNVWFLRHCLSK